MKHSIYFILIIPLLYFSCQEKQTTADVNERFNTFKYDFIESYWQQFPEHATMNGLHKYDDRLTIPDVENRNQVVGFANRKLEILQEVPVEELSDTNQIDYHLIRNELESAKWYVDSFKAWQWQPSHYNPGSLIGYMLKGRYAPLEGRLTAIKSRLAQLPRYYEVAKANLKEPTKPHTEMAITKTEGTLQLLESTLHDSLQRLETPLEGMDTVMEQGIEAVNGYLDYLNEQLDRGDFREYRIGQALYDRKFEIDMQAAYDVDGIWEVAMMEKDEAHVELLRNTQQLWPRYFGEKPNTISLNEVDSLIERISNKHVPADSFLEAIRGQIPRLAEFVQENNLVGTDESKPLEVREAPKYLQGVALASVSSPGPYDKFESTYYNVSPLWEYPDSVSESYLREYNDYMLQILNIHEAIPGHYTQLMHANESPSLVKSIFGNTTMIEGWACYAERMMLEEGWGNDQPELWLMYYKWYLRIITNTIIDIGVHAKGWDKEQVMDLLVNEAFQEKSEAEGKWNRVKRTSVQLCSYFTGLTEILDLRQDYQGEAGETFNLRQFHDQFLSYGSAPVKYIEQLMMENFEEEQEVDSLE